MFIVLLLFRRLSCTVLIGRGLTYNMYSIECKRPQQIFRHRGATAALAVPGCAIEYMTVAFTCNINDKC